MNADILLSAWQKRLGWVAQAVDERGRLDWHKWWAMPLRQRLGAMFNPWGLVLGPLYYLRVGLWGRGFVLVGGQALLYALAMVLEGLWGWHTRPWSTLAPILLISATRVNLDRYQHLQLGLPMWPALHVLGGRFFPGVFMVLALVLATKASDWGQEQALVRHEDDLMATLWEAPFQACPALITGDVLEPVLEDSSYEVEHLHNGLDMVYVSGDLQLEGNSQPATLGMALDPYSHSAHLLNLMLDDEWQPLERVNLLEQQLCGNFGKMI